MWCYPETVSLVSFMSPMRPLLPGKHHRHDIINTLLAICSWRFHTIPASVFLLEQFLLISAHLIWFIIILTFCQEVQEKQVEKDFWKTLDLGFEGGMGNLLSAILWNVSSRNSDQLISHMFNFLILLSYERYHSKTIIMMPKIIQLCDGIMASGLDPTTHGQNSHHHHLISIVIVNTMFIIITTAVIINCETSCFVVVS